MNHAQVASLGRALRVLGGHGDDIGTETSDDRLREIKDDLRRALELLDESVSGPAPTTRCREHPNGPVDKSAPDLCLLCETRRRSARRTQLSGRYSGGHGNPRHTEEKFEAVPSKYGIRADRPQPQQRWLPEAWNGQAWELCGTPRRDRQDAEAYLAARRRSARPAMAYRVVHEFTDYEVLRIWGEPRQIDIEPMGNI